MDILITSFLGGSKFFGFEKRELDRVGIQSNGDIDREHPNRVSSFKIEEILAINIRLG